MANVTFDEVMDLARRSNDTRLSDAETSELAAEVSALSEKQSVDVDDAVRVMREVAPYSHHWLRLMANALAAAGKLR